MDEDAGARGGLDQVLHRFVLDGVAVHGGEEAKHGEMPGGDEGRNLRDGARIEGVDHGGPSESRGKGLDGDGDRVDVLREAGDEHGLLDAVTVEFLDPGASENNGVLGGRLPAEDSEDRVQIRLLLLREQAEKAMREEVHVGVGDGEFTPGRSHS